MILTLIVSYTESGLIAAENKYEFVVASVNFSGLTENTVTLIKKNSKETIFLISETELPLELFNDEFIERVTFSEDPSCLRCYDLSSIGIFTFYESELKGYLEVYPLALVGTEYRYSRASYAERLSRKPGLIANWGLSYIENELDGQSISSSYGSFDLAGSFSRGGIFNNHVLYHIDENIVQRHRSSIDWQNSRGTVLVRVGDTSTVASSFESSRQVGGISIRKISGLDRRVDFPKGVRIDALATRPGIAELYIDAERRWRRKVSSGRVTVTDIPRRGEVATLRITDEFGGVQEFSSALTYGSYLTPKSKFDYDFSYGALRIAENRYVDNILSSRVAYGLSDNASFFLSGIGSVDQLALGYGFDLAYSKFKFSAAISDSYSYDSQVLNKMKLEGTAYNWLLSAQNVGNNENVTLNFGGQEGGDYISIDGTSPPSYLRANLSIRKSFGVFSGSLTKLDGLFGASLSFSKRYGKISLGISGFGVENGNSGALFHISFGGVAKTYSANSSIYGVASNESVTKGLAVDVVSRESEFYGVANVMLSEDRDHKTKNYQGKVLFDKQWEAVRTSVRHFREEGLISTQYSTRGGVLFDSFRPVFTREVSDSQGYLVVDVGVPGVEIIKSGGVVSVDATGKAVFPVKGNTPFSVSIHPKSLPAGYSIAQEMLRYQIGAGESASLRIAVSPPGFLLKISGASLGDRFYWNNRKYEVYEMGSYIEGANVGLNILTWGGRTYEVYLEPIDDSIPAFFLDTATGMLTKGDSR